MFFYVDVADSIHLNEYVDDSMLAESGFHELTSQRHILIAHSCRRLDCILIVIVTVEYSSLALVSVCI